MMSLEPLMYSLKYYNTKIPITAMLRSKRKIEIYNYMWIIIHQVSHFTTSLKFLRF